MSNKVLKAFSAWLRAAYLAGKSHLVRSRKMAATFLRRKNRYTWLGLLVLICAFSSVGIIAGSQWASTVIGTHGNLRVDGVGVYQDANCSVVVRCFDWGTLEPGSIRNMTFYVRNEGNLAATLSLGVANWEPANASDYMDISWNYDGRMLSPMETVGVTLSLYASPIVENIVSFSFDIIIGVNA